MVLGYLSLKNLVNASCVCKYWHACAKANPPVSVGKYKAQVPPSTNALRVQTLTVGGRRGIEDVSALGSVKNLTLWYCNGIRNSLGPNITWGQ